MSNIILTQIPAQATLKFYIIITQRNLILRLSRLLSNLSTKSSKSVFQLVPFNLKYINVTLSFTGNGISGKYFH